MAKKRLRDLTLDHPSAEERAGLRKSLASSGHPIALAVLGASLVEMELEKLLRPRFARNDDETWKALVLENGPLATFYQKITLGHAMRAYDDNFRSNLQILKNIRNAFAHSKMPLDFDNDLIKGELQKVKDFPGFKNEMRSVRKIKEGADTSYLILCLSLSTALLKRRTAALGYRNRRLQQRLARRQARELIGVANLALPIQGWQSLASLGRRIGDPNLQAQTEARKTILGAALTEAEKDRSDDK